MDLWVLKSAVEKGRISQQTAADSRTTTEIFPIDRKRHEIGTGRSGVDCGSNLVFYFWEGREPDNASQTVSISVGVVLRQVRWVSGGQKIDRYWASRSESLTA